MLDDGIHTLSYFHKNSVKSCNNLWLFYWWLLLVIWLLLIIIWWLLTIMSWLLMIIKKDCNKTNCSSIYKEVIRPVLNFLFFFTIRSHIFSKKHQKALKSTKKHQEAPKGTKKHNQFEIHWHKIYRFDKAYQAQESPKWKKVTYSLICLKSL